jgi:hypothetical protein
MNENEAVSFFCKSIETWDLGRESWIWKENYCLFGLSHSHFLADFKLWTYYGFVS